MGEEKRRNKPYTTGEASKALEAFDVYVHPRTVARWCDQGVFPGAWKTPGGQWRIPVRALAAFGEAKHGHT